MGDYIDSNGLRYLWTKIKNLFVQKESGKGLSTNDFTTAYKTKLDGIASGANKYTLPTATSTTLGGIKVGSGLSITGGGVLSTSGSSGITLLYEENIVISNVNSKTVNFDISKSPEFVIIIYFRENMGNIIDIETFTLPIGFSYYMGLSSNAKVCFASDDGKSIKFESTNGMNFFGKYYVKVYG